MNAPNRSAEVKAIFERLGLTHHPKTPTDEKRRENLWRIIRELNAIDDGKWGALLKTDQGNKIPGDIIVWHDTLEHFDVITGAGGPYWEAHGPIARDGNWLWWELFDTTPPVEPTPTPTPTPIPPIPPSPFDLQIVTITLTLTPERAAALLAWLSGRP